MSKTTERNMEERIPRTARNVYEKADKDLWPFFPVKKKYTTFVDIMDYTISNEEDADFDDIDMHDVINDIINHKFA